MTNKSGEIILALIVGLSVAMAGMALVTKRHNAIVVANGGVGVDLLKLGTKREVVTQNKGSVAAVIAASIAATIAADKIEIEGYPNK